VLAAEGETVLYISSHGPFEKGKDIITRAPNGEIRAYQLKANDVGLAEWRAIYGEITNLVELAIEHPSIGKVTKFTPYLVTNGELTDPVLEQVRVANVSWEGRGISNELRVVQKGELLDRFHSSHGAYLPRELSDFRTFLELLLRDGAFVADKPKAAQLLEGILPSVAKKTPGTLDIGRAAASAVLLTGYISRSAQSAENHWTVFEYWVIAASYILRLAEDYEVPEKYWSPSFELCELSAERALESLIADCEANPHLVQGNPLVDGSVYGARVTVLTGLLAASAVRKRTLRLDSTDNESILSFILKHLRNANMWGESAVPYFAMVALELHCRCRPAIGESLLIQLVREITAQNGQAAKGRGVPNVYYSPEQAIRLSSGLDFLNDESFVGHSYCVETLVDILARRWRRQAIASMWFSITRMSLATYVPASHAEWYRWQSSDGALESNLAREPQSWAELREAAESVNFQGLPPTIVARPQFATWFMLVYPQRFSRQLMKLIETAALSN